MTIVKRIAELEQEAKSLGLSVEYPKTKRGRATRKKATLVKVLQQHYLKERLSGESCPDHLAYMVSLESPMLCARLSDCKKELEEAIWRSSDWVLEPKFDGCRCFLVYRKDEGLHTYSRHLSTVDYLPIEWRSIYHGDPRWGVLEPMEEFILDSEVVSTNPHVSTVLGNRGVVTETMLQAVQALLALNSEESLRIQKELKRPLRFYVFDILSVRGHDLRDQPWTVRRQTASRVVAYLQEAGLNAFLAPVEENPTRKRAYYENILEMRGEGCVAKLKSGLYVARDTRSHRSFVKLKRTASESVSASYDSIDAFISGWEPGNKGTALENRIGTVYFSVLLDKGDGTQVEHEIARISSFTEEDRSAMEWRDSSGQLQLHPDYNRAVASVDGQAVSAREKRLRHARLIHWRPDRSWLDCTFDEMTLDLLIT